jgi:hypothetical protein
MRSALENGGKYLVLVVTAADRGTAAERAYALNVIGESDPIARSLTNAFFGIRSLDLSGFSATQMIGAVAVCLSQHASARTRPASRDTGCSHISPQPGSGMTFCSA